VWIQFEATNGTVVREGRNGRFGKSLLQAREKAVSEGARCSWFAAVYRGIRLDISIALRAGDVLTNRDGYIQAGTGKWRWLHLSLLNRGSKYPFYNIDTSLADIPRHTHHISQSLEPITRTNHSNQSLEPMFEYELHSSIDRWLR